MTVSSAAVAVLHAFYILQVQAAFGLHLRSMVVHHFKGIITTLEILSPFVCSLIKYSSYGLVWTQSSFMFFFIILF